MAHKSEGMTPQAESNIGDVSLASSDYQKQGPVRCLLKQMTLALASFIAFPFYMFYLINGLFRDKETAFQGLSQLMSLFPGLPGNFMRRGFYYLTLRRCSPDCTISFGTIFSTPDCEIGCHVYIGAYCIVSDSIIGDDVLIGSHVHIISGKYAHGFADPEVLIRLQPSSRSVIRIGENSWIGNGTIILADVGEGSVVGAGSVVVKKIADGSIAVGNPARVIRKREAVGAR